MLSDFSFCPSRRIKTASHCGFNLHFFGGCELSTWCSPPAPTSIWLPTLQAPSLPLNLLKCGFSSELPRPVKSLLSPGAWQRNTSPPAPFPCTTVLDCFASNDVFGASSKSSAESWVPWYRWDHREPEGLGTCPRTHSWDPADSKPGALDSSGGDLRARGCHRGPRSRGSDAGLGKGGDVISGSVTWPFRAALSRIERLVLDSVQYLCTPKSQILFNLLPVLWCQWEARFGAKQPLNPPFKWTQTGFPNFSVFISLRLEYGLLFAS